MIKKTDTNARRIKRHVRVRGKISGTPERPRLSVFRSSSNIYAQIIDDVNGCTLCAASSVEKDFTGGGNIESAKEVGKMIADAAKKAKIRTVVFDCGDKKYHGHIKKLAESARKAGLKF